MTHSFDPWRMPLYYAWTPDGVAPTTDVIEAFESKKKAPRLTHDVEDPEGRRWRVSTVFLALDHGLGLGDPLVWETMVFARKPDGSGVDWMDHYLERCSTEEEAIAQHTSIVNRLSQGTLELYGLVEEDEA